MKLIYWKLFIKTNDNSNKYAYLFAIKIIVQKTLNIFNKIIINLFIYSSEYLFNT